MTTDNLVERLDNQIKIIRADGKGGGDLDYALNKARDRIEALEAMLDARDRHNTAMGVRIEALEAERQGYYNEAAEGWSKFRAAEAENARLRAALKLLLSDIDTCGRDVDPAYVRSARDALAPPEAEGG